MSSSSRVSRHITSFALRICLDLMPLRPPLAIAKGRLRTKRAALERALSGHLRDHHRIIVPEGREVVPRVVAGQLCARPRGAGVA